MGGTICDLCKQDMQRSSGCMCDTVEIDGKKHKRVPVGNYGETLSPGERCHDCNAEFGKYHHKGCDTDKCPVCNGQAGMDCDCENFVYLIITERPMTDEELEQSFVKWLAKIVRKYSPEAAKEMKKLKTYTGAKRYLQFLNSEKRLIITPEIFAAFDKKYSELMQ